jgi:hypothetical protein
VLIRLEIARVCLLEFGSRSGLGIFDQDTRQPGVEWRCSRKIGPREAKPSRNWELGAS